MDRGSVDRSFSTEKLTVRLVSDMEKLVIKFKDDLEIGAARLFLFLVHTRTRATDGSRIADEPTLDTDHAGRGSRLGLSVWHFTWSMWCVERLR